MAHGGNLDTVHEGLDRIHCKVHIGRWIAMSRAKLETISGVLTAPRHDIMQDDKMSENIVDSWRE